MHLTDCPVPSDCEYHYGSLSLASHTVDVFPWSKSDVEFHSLKYQLAVRFSKVADILAASQLPEYPVVMDLDRDMRAVVADAPSWLHWRENHDVEEEKHMTDDARSRRIPQRHMAALLLHKGVLGG